MDGINLCHLSVHSEYSIIDGSMKISQIIDKVKSMGHSHLALTDHGVMSAAFEFYEKCLKSSITPIIGCTLYIDLSPELKSYLANLKKPIVNDYNHYKNQNTPNNQPYNHQNLYNQIECFQLTLLAKNNHGYHKLLKIVSEAFEFGLSDDDIPICNFDILRDHLNPSQNNLIIMCGGSQSELGFLIKNHIEHLTSNKTPAINSLKNDLNLSNHEFDKPQILDIDADTLDKLTASYINILKDLANSDSIFLKLMNNNLMYDHATNAHLIKLAKKNSIECVASANVYYLNHDDAFNHSICLAIKNSLTEDHLSQKNTDADFHLLDNNEFLAKFKNYPRAINNTIKIANMCSGVDLSFKKHHLPNFLTVNYSQIKNLKNDDNNCNSSDSKDKNPVDENILMADLAKKGLKDRILSNSKLLKKDQIDEYTKRLHYEISIIKKMGFSGYFLIVQDFINWAKSQKIAVGPGRGSGAGSLVAYCLGITDIDPILWGLIFERFLNPERVSLPDFDVDFCQWRREEVINYVTQKYGKSKVCHIVTYGKLMAKASLKNTARIMGINFLKINNLTKMFPNELNITLSEVLNQSTTIKEIISKDDNLKRAMTEALKLEGVISHLSTHAAGIIISDNDITDYAPTFRTKAESTAISQFEMKSLEKSGLVKFDFLGLKTLTVIDLACKYINSHNDPDFDINKIPFNDTNVFELLSKGHTTGVFQAESYGMTELSKKLSPSRFEDIIALVALFRPGPLSSGMVDDFIERKHQRQSITYLHPLLEDILQETYGLIVYQEQVQKIASILANYTLAEADLLRRAMGKKIPEEMSKQTTRFLKGCKKNNIDNSLSQQIFDLMAEFAKYGFNKSHSAAYGLILYQTAYLKHYFPHGFILGIMNSDYDQVKKFKNYFIEWQRIGVEVLSPSINFSDIYFSFNKDYKLLFGLAAIKGFGQRTASIIVNDRKKHGKFKDLLDFITRIDLTVLGKKAWDVLVKCGALDEFKIHRRILMKFSQDIIKHSQSVNQITPVQKKTTSLFDFAKLAQKINDKHFDDSKNQPKWYKQLIDDSSGFINKLFDFQHLVFEKNLLGDYFSDHPLDLFTLESKYLNLKANYISDYKKNRLNKDFNQEYYEVIDKSKYHNAMFIAFLENTFFKETSDNKKSLDIKLSDKDFEITGTMFEKNLNNHIKLPDSSNFVIVSGYIKYHQVHKDSLVINKIENACDVLGKKLLMVDFIINDKNNFLQKDQLSKALSESECELESSDNIPLILNSYPIWLSNFLEDLKNFSNIYQGITKTRIILNIDHLISDHNQKLNINNPKHKQKNSKKQIIWNLNQPVFINNSSMSKLKELTPDFIHTKFHIKNNTYQYQY